MTLGAVSEELSTFFCLSRPFTGWLLVVCLAIEPQGSSRLHLPSSGVTSRPNAATIPNTYKASTLLRELQYERELLWR